MLPSPHSSSRTLILHLLPQKFLVEAAVSHGESLERAPAERMDEKFGEGTAEGGEAGEVRVG